MINLVLYIVKNDIKTGVNFEREGLSGMKIKFGNKYVKWGFTAFMVIAVSILFGYIIFNGS